MPFLRAAGKLMKAGGKLFKTKQYIFDNFQSYSTGNLAGQGNWVSVYNSLTVIDVSGDKRVHGGILNLYSTCVRTEAFSGDHYAQLEFDAVGTTPSDSVLGVAVRLQNGGTDNTCFCLIFNYDSTYYLTAIVNGTETSIATGNSAIAAGTIIRLEIEGQTLRAFKNGAAIGAGTWDVTSYNITGGKPGLFGHLNTSYVQGDDFEAGDL